MHRVLLFLAAPLLLAALACGLCAGPVYYPPGYVQHGHRDVVVVKEIVQLIEVAQINPAYSSALTVWQFDGRTQAEEVSELRRLAGKVDQLATRVEQLTTRPANPPAPSMPPAPVPVPVPPMPHADDPPMPDGPGTGLAVLNARCILCHQAGHLSPETRFTLLDAKGNLLELSDAQRLEVIQRIYASEMPPPRNKLGVPKLTAQERLAVLATLRK